MQSAKDIVDVHTQQTFDIQDTLTCVGKKNRCVNNNVNDGIYVLQYQGPGIVHGGSLSLFTGTLEQNRATVTVTVINSCASPASQNICWEKDLSSKSWQISF